MWDKSPVKKVFRVDLNVSFWPLFKSLMWGVNLNYGAKVKNFSLGFWSKFFRTSYIHIDRNKGQLRPSVTQPWDSILLFATPFLNPLDMRIQNMHGNIYHTMQNFEQIAIDPFFGLFWVIFEVGNPDYMENHRCSKFEWFFYQFFSIFPAPRVIYRWYLSQKIF